MKRLLSIVALLITANSLLGQATVGRFKEVYVTEETFFGRLTSDPPVTVNGVQYYNTTTNKMRMRIAGTWVDVNTGSGSGTTINNNGNNRLITGSGTANTLEGEESTLNDGVMELISSSAAYTHFHANGVSHPFTFGGSFGATMAARIGIVSTSVGGSLFQGFSSGDNAGMLFQGHIGSASPGVSPIIFEAWKTNGGTDRTALTGTQKIFSLKNGSTELISANAAGFWTTATEAYDASGWNGSNRLPTMDAVRDKIEAMSAASGQSEAQVAAQIHDSLTATTLTMDNANIGDTIMRSPSAGLVQYKGLVEGNGVYLTPNDSTITFHASPLVFSQIASVTVANTTTETTTLGTLAGANSVDGAGITTGAVIKMKGSGTIATGSGGRDITIQFKFSNVQIGPVVTGLGASQTFPYNYEVTFIPRSTGTNQPVVVSYSITIGATPWIGTSVTTMTTTGTLTGDFLVDWGTADAANIVTAMTNSLEIIRIH